MKSRQVFRAIFAGSAQFQPEHFLASSISRQGLGPPVACRLGRSRPRPSGLPFGASMISPSGETWISAGTGNACRGEGLIARKCSTAGGDEGAFRGLGQHADPDPRRPDDAGCMLLGGQGQIYHKYYKIKTDPPNHGGRAHAFPLKKSMRL